jgi:hypothetical protein
MPEFFKEKNFEFSLKSKEAFEDFTIWPAYQHKGEEIFDGAGNKLEFPIKDGAIVCSDGKTRNIDELRILPKAIFEKLLPKMSKTIRYLREVYVSGVEMYVLFTKVANDQIISLVRSAESMGQDPMKCMFKQTYFEKAAPMNKYKVEVIGQVTPAAQAPQTPVVTGQVPTPQAPAQTETVQPAPVPQQAAQTVNVDVTPTPQVPQLDEKEAEILRQLKEHKAKGTVIDLEKMKAILAGNQITDENRVNTLWSLYRQ